MQFTLIDLWSHMGLAARLIAVTMLAMSLVSLAVVFERLVALSASRRDSLRFATSMAELLADGDVEKAANAPPVASAGHLGRVIQAGFRAYRTAPKAHEDLVFESVARALERQAGREVHDMKRGVGVLASVGSTAPFVGLLGTVLGIVNSFQMMATTGSGGLATVSSGIAEALATTALGLVVAIPAVTAYNALQGFIDARAVDISEASNELLDLVARYARARSAQAGAPAAEAGAMDKQNLGLIFFESTSGLPVMQPELSAAGGDLVQANGSEYIAAFKGGAKAALGAAQRLFNAKLSQRVFVDLAPVTVQVRADGTSRFFSPLFSKKDQFPGSSEAAGLYLSAAAARALPDVKGVAPLTDQTGRFRIDTMHGSMALGQTSQTKRTATLTVED
jgi:biopolymer transport protein ExbB/biopolymer transport protein TolQ